MAFVRPSLSDLSDRIQADLTTRLALNGVLLRRSTVGVLARALAGAVHGLHGHLEYLAQQVFPDSSDVAFLERQAALYGITRLAATYATGTVTFTGSNGAGIAAGTELQRADGAMFTVDADVYIASGTATAAVTAVDAGVAGNTDAGVALTCVSPILNVNTMATVVAPGLEGGSDPETDDALRDRVVTRMRVPPHGGAAADYVAWTKEVAGVTRAWVSPQELGAGTVTVRFVRDDDGSGAAIIPDAGAVADVQAYINARRPVTAAVTALAPVAVTRNFTIHIAPDSPDIRAAVQAELEDLLRREAEPGATLLLSHIRTAIAAAAGVNDYTLTSPAADVSYTTGQMPIMGTITWT